MPKQDNYKQISDTLESLEFSLRNAEDLDQELHEELKTSILAWAESHSFDEGGAREVWMATYEAIRNALEWGSDPGQTINIRLHAIEKGLFEVEIEQPREWSEGPEKLGGRRSGAPGGKVRKEEIALGGVVMMQRLANDISVREEGRKIVMRFAR